MHFISKQCILHSHLKHALCRKYCEIYNKIDYYLRNMIFKECLFVVMVMNLPQILSGASNSSSMGCCRNISLDLVHRPRTSDSDICTVLPGLHPRTGTTFNHFNLSIIIFNDKQNSVLVTQTIRSSSMTIIEEATICKTIDSKTYFGISDLNT